MIEYIKQNWIYNEVSISWIATIWGIFFDASSKVGAIDYSTGLYINQKTIIANLK